MLRIVHSEHCSCVICEYSQCEIMAERFTEDGVLYLAKSVSKNAWEWNVNYTVNGINGCMKLNSWNTRARASWEKG